MNAQPYERKKPIINAHIHTFTWHHVPVYIARSFIPQPLDRLTHIGFMLKVFRFTKKRIRWVKQYIRNPLRRMRSYIAASQVLSFVFGLLVCWLLINALFYILDLTDWRGDVESAFWQWCQNAVVWAVDANIIIDELHTIGRIAWIVLLFIVSPLSRNAIWQVLTYLFKPLRMIPGKGSRDFLGRYFKIVEFTKANNQADIYNKVRKMYPEHSRMVVLPMDMEFMRAGPVTTPYLKQLAELNELKNRDHYDELLPFIFVDPRRIRSDRIADANEKPFFDWMGRDGKIELKDCLIKDYLEKIPGNPGTGHFCGIKIYPALGYYPFDEELLPLWLYCAQRQIPVTTHCIIGTVFYRGRLKSKWFTHPVFRYSSGKPLRLHRTKNYEFQVTWTHPLNYLVLLEEYFLRQQLSTCRKEIQDLFGYTVESDKLKVNLRNLKINLAHFGGDDQWARFMDQDRDEQAFELIENPEHGIYLCHHTRDGQKDGFNPGKPAWLWNRKQDWYSIICSLMLQYPNVYADLSYIIHSPSIYPLLHHSLLNEKLSQKILFGTDFYVVRNHKSEKEMFAQLLNAFTEEQVDLMARHNPCRFLVCSEA